MYNVRLSNIIPFAATRPLKTARSLCTIKRRASTAQREMEGICTSKDTCNWMRFTARTQTGGEVLPAKELYSSLNKKRWVANKTNGYT